MPGKSSVVEIFSHPTLRQIFRYGITTSLSYCFILGAMYLAVDRWGLSKSYSYAVINAINYIAVYIAYSRFVFRNTIDKSTLLRFISFLGFSWVVSYLFFLVLSSAFSLHYILIVILNTIILGSLRFFANKLYVFKK